MNSRPCLKLTVPMRDTYLPMALLHVRESAAIFGAPASIAQKIEIACEEAVTHLMEHGEFFEGDETLEIACNRLDDGMEIVLHEMGIPFDPKRQPGFQPAQSLEEFSTRGLGLYLMQQFMDHVEFSNMGSNGIRMRLAKHWESAPAGEPARPAETASVPQSFDVRVATPEDAIEITRCAYRSHGYSFFDAKIYDYRQLAMDIQNGSIYSVITVEPGGKVLGHIAVVRSHPDDPIVECTYVFVDPNLRGGGVSKKIGNLVFDYLIRNPSIRGWSACSVSNHVFSQKLVANYRANVCGIQLASCVETWRFKGIASDLGSQRNSDVIAFMPIDRSVRTVFLPVRHRDAILQLYQALGLERSVGDPGPSVLQPLGPSQIEVDVMEDDRTADIDVIRPGGNLIDLLRKTLRRLCVQGIVSILIRLPLEAPATSAMVPLLEDLGFFFAGILPLTRIGDALLLQYLNNVTVDYAKIQIHSEGGRRLLEYIQSCDPWRELDRP